MTLEEGTYFIYFNFHWNQRVVQQVVLGAYSENEVEFFEVTDPQPLGNLNILRDIIKCNALTGKGVKVKDFSKKNIESADKIKVYEASKFGLIYYYYSNQSKDLTLAEKISFPTMINYKIANDEIVTGNEIKFTLKPTEEKIIILFSNLGQEGKLGCNTITEIGEFANDKELIARIKGKGKLISEPLSLYAESFKYGGGELIYLTNEGKKKVKVNIKFPSIENYTINGEVREKISVELPAGISKLVRMDMIDLYGKKGIEYSYNILA